MIILSAIIGTARAEQYTSEQLNTKGIQAPLAVIKPHKRDIHNDQVIDDYYWMNDFFKEGPDAELVIDYLKKENDYTNAVLKPTEKLQEQLFQEMKARIREKDESVPYLKNGYYYYTRTEDGQQYFKFCRKKDELNASEEILLDIDAMAVGYAYYAATGFSVSPDNNLMSFGVDTVSRREYTIFIKNLLTGEIYKDEIPKTSGNSTWAKDNKTLYYTAKNPVTLLSEKINRHTLGTLVDDDVTVYEEIDNTNYIGVGKSKNGEYIFIESEGTLSSEVFYLKSDDPAGNFQVFQPRMKNVLYHVTALEDRFLIVTNDEAKNFKVMQCQLGMTSREHWRAFIPHREDVLVSEVDEFKDYLVVTERKNGLSQIAIHNLHNEEQYYLDFGEVAYTVYPSTNVEYDTQKLRFGYTSLVTPLSTYEYDMVTREKILLKQQEVVGGYDTHAYSTERIFAKASDGTAIPISLVYKNGIKKDGSAPLLLYAYGSYGYAIDPTFNSARLSLLDRGFVYAIAHIRGGEEMGRQWYEEGKMMNKINTFTDFISCGHYLIDQKFTSLGHLYAQGGSAGGLLMGAIANMEPNLWNGIIAQVPFVDVVNTMLDEGIPLTTNEYDEWGNPNEKEAYYYMKSYSPYENIEGKEYPNILVTTGLHDSQVQYFEPAKWVAKLRKMKTDNHVLLLKTDMEYGHGGASGRFDYLKDIALSYAFLFALEHIEK
ncbi:MULTISPECIES: S9 family peptidase [Sphingobacterium]|uniref:S9 family peptidase n=1 Tax=Sphingobacterium TaxID=28453 RepID=UPI001052D5CE|nr:MULTISPECIES: S9 family peptidase [Sphingobacterium]MCW2261449.1 oligopeptidase B [Sphingobacterium kitahiroshimense]TCR09760.1 oligopeptidase B [Sphingobacterium sp. JUb78]